MRVSAKELQEHKVLNIHLYNVYTTIKVENSDILDSDILIHNHFLDIQEIFKVYKDFETPHDIPLDDYVPVLLEKAVVHETYVDLAYQAIRNLMKHDIFLFALDDNTAYFATRESIIAWDDLPEDVTNIIDSLTIYLGAQYKDVVDFLSIDYIEFADAFYKANGFIYNKPDYGMELKYMPQIYYVKAIERNATDIFFDTKKWGVEINYLVLGDQYNLDRLELDRYHIDQFSESVLNLEVNTQTSDRIKITTRNASILNLGQYNNKYLGRVNHYGNFTGDTINTRVLDDKKSVIPFDDLNISDSRKNVLRLAFDCDTGIVVSAGTTGAGKTTLMASYITGYKEANPLVRGESLESPPEYTIPCINQLAFITDDDDQSEGVKLHEAIKAFTRRANQLSYMTEVNDPFTADAAIQMAQMSKFVLTTLHTSSVALIPSRIRGMVDDVKYNMFMDNIKLLMHQVMLKQACPDCKKIVNIKNYPLKESQRKILDYFGYTAKTLCVIDKEKCCKCKTCNGVGYITDKPIISLETLYVTNKVKRELLKQPTMADIHIWIQEYLVNNNLSGVQDALSYVARGVVTFDLVWKKYSLNDYVDDIALDQTKIIHENIEENS